MRRGKICALTSCISSFTKKEKEKKERKEGKKGGRKGGREEGRRKEGGKPLKSYNEAKESWIGMGEVSKNWSC